MNMRLRLVGILVASILSATVFSREAWSASPTPASNADGRTERQRIQVGPRRDVKSIGDAAMLAGPGALVEVDAGDYLGDTAVWTQDGISLRAVGGRVHLIADGKSAEGKGIWVVRAEQVSVEGFDFEGATVRDRNGAGIRLDRGSLRVRDCTFMRNENGILTNNRPDTVLEVENSEFGYNGAGDGYGHNLYAGTIARLSVTGSYFHHARRGHLLKSRAAFNYVAYNRLTDEQDGQASYELEFPSGGRSYVIGNIIQQSALSENRHLISVGVEGYKWPSNEIYLINNTLVDNGVQDAVFLRVSPGATAITVVNNLLVGGAGWDVGAAATFRNNPSAGATDFESLRSGDFRLVPHSRAWGKTVDPGSANGVALLPTREYRHPRHTVPLGAPPIEPGAVQAPAPKP